MQAHLTIDFESSSSLTLPTPNTMDNLPVRDGEPYQRALRRGRGEGSERQMTGNLREAVVHNLPTPKAQEAGSTSPGYGDSLNDFASRITKGYAPKDLLRSPTASQGEGGALGEDEARRRGNTVGIRDQAMDLAALNGEKITRLPTPVATDWKNGRSSDGFGKNLSETTKAMLPTPTTQDGKNNAGPSQFKRNSNPLNVEAVLLPTTRTSMKNGATAKEVAAGNPKHRLEAVTNWGKFEPAIRRWEEVLGRPAPAPTKPDGKDGAHRLSSAFTEWMMGVPEGWITDVGLTRNEELKACGNGVVPQQAELALRVLLEGLTMESGGGQVNLPTPTVSDTFTGNLKSTQQKPGSMHSVTLPQAVNMVAVELEEDRP